MLKQITWKLPVVPRRGLLRRVKRMLAKCGIDELHLTVRARSGKPLLHAYRFCGDSSGRYFEEDAFYFIPERKRYRRDNFK